MNLSSVFYKNHMRALIVEPNTAIGNLLKTDFLNRDIILDCVSSFDEAFYQTTEYEYEVIIFDPFKPSVDGVDFLKKLRREPNGIPILVTATQATITDKKRLFELGADDFLSKPYDTEELYLRIRALGRRKHGFFGAIMDVQGVAINLNAKTCMFAGEPIVLTATEYNLLEYLLLRQNHVVSRERINRELYRDEKEQMSNVVDVLMSKIRKKLKEKNAPTLINTVRGEGYIIRNRTSAV